MVRDGKDDRDQLREVLLVLRSQAGDEDAFSDLFDRFGHRTLRYLEGLLGPELAADTQQEVWLAVFRGIARLTNPRAFRTWLYQTTRNRAIDVLRRERRESELFLPATPEAPQPAAETPDPLLESQDRQSLKEGMAELSAPHLEVLLLRYWEEMSYSEIALIVGCSVGTVRSRLHHAKRRLREAIDRLQDRAETVIRSTERQGGKG
jgi:RNA polymerase sigma-70 factor (ECF subfamily)